VSLTHQLTASTFNQLDQYANSPGHRTYQGYHFMQDSPFSSLAEEVTIASTHFAYPQRLSLPGWLG